MDMNWNIIRKSRTSITRRPRKPGTDTFGLRLKSRTKKFGADNVVIAPLKKRKLLRKSTSPNPQTPCLNGEVGLTSGPQTPAVHHEDSAQRCSNLSTPGIELLADAAISSLVDDNADHVKDLSLLKEHVKPKANSCDDVGIKEAIVSTGLDSGNEGSKKMVTSSKELRLHWDLNTVMDEWVEPCDDLVAGPNRHDGREVMDAKTISSKTSYVESYASKSDVIDLLTHPVKREDFLATTTSILREHTVVKVESDIKLEKSDQQPSTLEDPVVSECCGSNVTQEEQGHMAEGDSDGKLEVGYDSPFEDGELREPIGWEDSQVEEKETVDCASDNINKADSGTMENPSSERVDHGQTKEIQSSLLVKEATPNNDTDQGAQADICEKKHIDEPAKGFSEREDGQEESRFFDVCRNGAYVPQSRSNRFGDSYSMGRNNVSFRDRSGDDVSGPRGNSSTRVWDEKSNGSLDSRSNHYRNYNPYRSQYRTPSPSERNYGYNRGPPARRSHSRDRDHDHFRLTQRPTTFPNKYKDIGDAIRKHDDHYEKVSRVGNFDDNGGMRRFRYAVDDNHRNLDSYSRDDVNEHTPERKS
nr:hypothetical protein [Tanacetum cinerariifolium]